MAEIETVLNESLDELSIREVKYFTFIAFIKLLFNCYLIEE